MPLMLEETPSWTLTSYLQLGENYCRADPTEAVVSRRRVSVQRKRYGYYFERFYAAEAEDADDAGAGPRLPDSFLL